MSRIIALLLVASAFVFSASAQSSQTSYGVDVTAIFHADDETTALKKDILSSFREELALRGVTDSGKTLTRLFIDARTVSLAGDSQIVLSITQMDRLPQEVVDLGAEHEAFYLHFSMDDLPPEGTAVRQAFSRDWLEQYFVITGQEIFVIAPSDLKRTVSEYVDRHLAE